MAELKKGQGKVIAVDDIARQTGLDGQEIGNIIQYFRESGIELTIDDNKISLNALPDTLLPAILLCGLKTRNMGHEIHSYKTIGSTNETAKRLAEAGAPEGTLVISEKQTKGRGRLGRSWHSPGHGLYFSLILKPDLEFARFPALSMVAALSICNSLEQFGDIKAQIKWPNDCLLNGKKAAGILVELSAELDKVSYAILGIGVNVNNERGTFPSHLRSKATSLFIETGKKIDRTILMQIFLSHFEKSYYNFIRYGLRSVAHELVKRPIVLDHNITIRIGKKRISGMAMGFDGNGALRLKTKDGVKVISAGEVTLR